MTFNAQPTWPMANYSVHALPSVMCRFCAFSKHINCHAGQPVCRMINFNLMSSCECIFECIRNRNVHCHLIVRIRTRHTPLMRWRTVNVCFDTCQWQRHSLTVCVTTFLFSLPIVDLRLSISIFRNIFVFEEFQWPKYL